MGASDRIERCVREYERAFRRLTENASEGFWISDPEFRTIYVNPAFEEIWGRPRERLQGDPRTTIEAIHPEDRERVERAIEGMIDTGAFDEVYRVRRPDGSLRWVHDRGFPVRDEEGEIVDIAGIATDVTHRKRVERTLRCQRDRTEWLIETSPVMILVLNEDRTITFANERAEELAGVEGIAGTPFEAFPWQLIADGEPLTPGERPFDLVRERDEPMYGRRYRAEIGGRTRWLRINAAPLFEDGTFDGAVFAIEDITRQKRREDALSGLHGTTREMMRADSEAAVYDAAVAATREHLGLSAVAGYRFDADGPVLRPAAHAPAAAEFVEREPRIDGGPVWTAFVERAVEREGDLTAIPLGSHGVLALWDEVDEERLSVVRVLCDNVEAALDRTNRERDLRTRREELRRANAELERLNHVTDLVRGVTGALVRADSREEITRTVCERLAAADPYRFAWVGERREGFVPTAQAGITESALDGLDREDSAAARAARTGEPVIERELIESGCASQRADALSQDYRAVAAVPLGHRDRSYGVLSVHAVDGGAFREDEREVLVELGETVGYAIDAVETRNALASDGVTELRFAVEDPECLPAALAVGGKLDHRGVVPRDDGTIRWFCTVDAPADRVQRAADDDARVTSCNPTEADGRTLLDCAVRPPCLLSPFLDRGVSISSLTATPEGTTVIAETAVEDDVRALCEALEAEYDGVELTGRWDLDRPPRTREERRNGIAADLTDRQREILRIAHLSGYFETPRRITGAELAESLGINRSTFHRTLRAAEQTSFDGLLE
ncbi:PAS domain S-box protein [Halalkalicoccus subterraneus]|uniref:PAS domain S-box protein n=1 Tax=Halalkalicoccus subterraneus TaxID=2675002 RepID=UPI000EFB27D0|nr:PAS domain S-box protein [Halalkalicoccus subterraneus]